MGGLEFEWDEAKAALNFEKRGVTFLTAAAIFDNQTIGRVDDREDYVETRIVALGRVQTEVYRVVFTWRGERKLRIISAQKAGRPEREFYYSEVFPA